MASQCDASTSRTAPTVSGTCYEQWTAAHHLVDPCGRCVEASKMGVRLQRLVALEAKMKKSNIDMGDFAELILVRIEASIEERMRRVVAQLVRESLRKVHFQVKAQ